jgi:hypothetical protein
VHGIEELCDVTEELWCAVRWNCGVLYVGTVVCCTLELWCVVRWNCGVLYVGTVVCCTLELWCAVRWNCGVMYVETDYDLVYLMRFPFLAAQFERLLKDTCEAVHNACY